MGHPGIGQLGPGPLGHPGLGQMGPGPAMGGHPGLGQIGPGPPMGGHPGLGQIGPGPPMGGHPGLGQIGPGPMGHPGIGQLGSTRGHPGLGMPPPSWNQDDDDISMDEPGVIRIKTVGVLQPPSMSGDQSRCSFYSNNTSKLETVHHQILLLLQFLGKKHLVEQNLGMNWAVMNSLAI